MKVFVLSLAILIGVVHSQPRTERTLNLAIMEFPPYEFQSGTKVDGISVRIVREIFKRIGQPITIKILPWSRALWYLEQGQIDGVFQVLEKEDRKRYIDYSSVVLMDEKASLFVRKDSSITFSGEFESLSGHTFGVRQGFSYGSSFDSAIANKTINKVSATESPEQLLIMLSHGRIDILIGDKYGTPFLYKKIRSNNIHNSIRYSDIKILQPDVQSTPAYMGFSKKNQLEKIRDEFDKTLLKIKEDGTYNEIISSFNFSN